jgi:hypothetical protein
MPSSAHEDIRRLLKEFGLTADETVSSYLVETRPSRPLRLRLTLEDITDYDHQLLDDATDQETGATTRADPPLRVVVEGEIGPLR